YISATKRSRSRIASIETMAQAHQAVSAACLDVGNLLNCNNGTLDLDTFRFRQHSPGDLLTYCLDYEYRPDADCPRFRQYIDEVLVGEDGHTPDRDLARLHQELMGCSLTTDNSHETMIWLAGDGGNGKTVDITILRDLLRPLAV